MKMVNFYLNLSIFTVFLKKRNLISKIRTSKVTDYAALTGKLGINMYFKEKTKATTTGARLYFLAHEGKAI